MNTMGLGAQPAVEGSVFPSGESQSNNLPQRSETSGSEEEEEEEEEEEDAEDD